VHGRLVLFAKGEFDSLLFFSTKQAGDFEMMQRLPVLYSVFCGGITFLWEGNDGYGYLFVLCMNVYACK
jgi:hypothetical protein